MDAETRHLQIKFDINTYRTRHLQQLADVWKQKRNSGKNNAQFSPEFFVRKREKAKYIRHVLQKTRKNVRLCS